MAEICFPIHYKEQKTKQEIQLNKLFLKVDGKPTFKQKRIKVIQEFFLLFL